MGAYTVAPESAASTRRSRTGLWKSRFRRFLREMAIFSAIGAVTLIAGEGMVRLVGIRPFPPHRGDPVFGPPGYAPNSRIRTKFPEYDKSGILWIITNNLGFPQEEFTAPAKTPGTRRIAIVGDSQTAGAVASRESYPHQFQENLNKDGKGAYEILNGGVGRYSPYQYYLQAVHNVMPLKPDQLVVAIYAGNDMQDLIRRDDRPYLTIERDGSFTEHSPEWVVWEDPGGSDEWLRNSRLFSWVKMRLGPNVVYQIKRGRLLLHNFLSEGASVPTIWNYSMALKKLSDAQLGFVTQDMNQHLWFKYFPHTLEPSYRMNRQVMKMFKELSKKNNFRLTYLVIPAKVQIEPDLMPQALAAAGKVDPTLTEQNIRAFADAISDEVIREAQAEGIEYIDPRAELLRRRAGRQLYFTDDMHLNPTGDQLMGQIAADWVRSHGL